ncbi:hypothetical protein VNI00_010259 [Paramarasmius palmivorus]|uniref:Uncharacterized protein n=1 Tax=Paramarasmius palmivorus TaxID=297713 RepID=A0AAW0CJL1_9AGAR
MAYDRRDERPLDYFRTLQPAGSFDNPGILGPPYNHTLHGTKQNGASFLFDFEGASNASPLFFSLVVHRALREFIQVRGAKGNRKLPQDPAVYPFDNVTLAKWSCQVNEDDITLSSHFRETDDITHIALCEQGSLFRKKYTLNLTVFIDNSDTQMFWVDEIEYQPLHGLNLQKEILKIDSSDPSVRYDNWSQEWLQDENGIMHNVTASAETRTQVALYGVNDGFKHRGNGNASYHINGSRETPFETPERRVMIEGAKTSSYYNQLTFATQKLKAGSHEMAITCGNSRAVFPQPLSIDYFYVTSGEDAAQLNYTGSGGSNTGDTIKGESGDSRTPTGPIIGGVLDGVVGLILLVGIILLVLERQRKRRPGRPGSINNKDIFDSPEIFLFPLPISNHGITSKHLTVSEFGGSPSSTTFYRWSKRCGIESELEGYENCSAKPVAASSRSSN